MQEEINEISFNYNQRVRRFRVILVYIFTDLIHINYISNLGMNSV